MDGMLEDARAVAEREEMTDPDLRDLMFYAPENDPLGRKHDFRPGALACRLEGCEIPLGRLRPGHRPARGIRPFAHGMAADIVSQQAGDLDAQGFGICK